MRAMRVLFLTGLLSSAAGAVLAAKDHPATRPATQPTTHPTKAINAFCPVDPEHEVDPDVTVVYEGKIIGFCCTDCIQDFQKDPKKYVKNLEKKAK